MINIYNMKKVKRFFKALWYKEYTLSVLYNDEHIDYTINSIKDLNLIMDLHTFDLRTHKWRLYKKGRFFLPKRLIDYGGYVEC